MAIDYVLFRLRHADIQFASKRAQFCHADPAIHARMAGWTDAHQIAADHGHGQILHPAIHRFLGAATAEAVKLPWQARPLVSLPPLLQECNQVAAQDQRRALAVDGG